MKTHRINTNGRHVCLCIYLVFLIITNFIPPKDFIMDIEYYMIKIVTCLKFLKFLKVLEADSEVLVERTGSQYYLSNG